MIFFHFSETVRVTGAKQMSFRDSGIRF